MATPTLNLTPDVQTRYNQAMADPTIANNPQAVASLTQRAQAQSQQEQQSQTQQASPVPSKPESFLQKTGDFVKNNLSTIGAVALPAVADLATGGLAIPADAALAAVGGGLGEAGTQALNGQGVTSGSNLKNDVVQGGINGVASLAGAGLGKLIGGAASKLGGVLGKEADDTAVQSLGLTQGNRNQFFSKTGQTVSDFLKEHGISGGTADDVQSVQDALQAQYNNIARTSGVKVPVSTLRSNVLNNLGGLAEDATQEGKNALNETWNRYNDMIQSIPKDEQGNIDIGELTKQKANIQSATKFGSDSTAATTQANQILSKSFKDTVNQAADEAGLTAPDGTPLSQLGQKLNKFNTLTDILAKKEPGQVGTSALVKAARNTILPVAGGTIGDKVGGVPGAIIGGTIGLLGDAAGTNPAVLSALSSLESKGAGALAKSAVPTVAGRIGTNAAAQTLGAAATNQPSIPTTPPPTLAGGSPTSSVPTTPTLSGQDLVSQGVAALQSGQPLTQSQYQALIEKDLTTTGGRFSDKITAAYQAGNPSGVQGLGVAANAANTLQSLYGSAGGAQGPISGSIENALGKTGLTDQAVQAYNKQATALGQEIISQIYGSTGTASDRDQVLSLIPQISDSPQVAQSKMATLRTLIQQRLSSMTGSTPGSVTSLNSGLSLNLNQ